MKGTSAGFAGIWLATLILSVRGFAAAEPVDACFMDTPLWVQLLPVLLIGAAAYFFTASPFLIPELEKIMDEYFGEGSYAGFLQRLKPLLLAAACFGAATLGAIWNCSGGGTPSLPACGGFLFACCTGLAMAHHIMRMRKLPGV